MVDQRRSFAGVGTLLDFGPQVDQETNVGAEIVFAGAFRSGADDEAAGRVALLADQHALQALALFVGGDFTGDADVVDRGHEDQEAAGQRDVAGDARTFAGDGLLGNLDQNFLPLLQQLADDGQVRGLHAGTTATLTAPGLATSYCGHRHGGGSGDLRDALEIPRSLQVPQAHRLISSFADSSV